MLKYDAYQLKLFAIIGMILNHMVIGWYEVLPLWLSVPMYAAGGLTFPIMAYFISEGYRHTSNLKRYVLRILLFGCIALPFHALVFGYIGLNIMFTIALGIFALWLNDKMQKRVLFWIIFVLLCILSTFPLPFDWSIIGLIVLLMMHRIQDENKRRVRPAIVAGIFMFVASGLSALMFSNPEFATMAQKDDMSIGLVLVGLSFIIGCFFAALLLKNFTGERGKRMKWMFYAFYPLHLLFIAAVGLALGIIDFSVFGF